MIDPGLIATFQERAVALAAHLLLALLPDEPPPAHDVLAATGAVLTPRAIHEAAITPRAAQILNLLRPDEA